MFFYENVFQHARGLVKQDGAFKSGVFRLGGLVGQDFDFNSKGGVCHLLVNTSFVEGRKKRWDIS